MVKTQYPGNAREVKRNPICSMCKNELSDRVPRGPIVKNFLFWLPIKRYVCYKCQRKTYVWVNQ